MRYIIPLLVLLFTLAACDDDKEEARPNIYDGFTVAPQMPHAGDSLTLTAHVREPGAHQIKMTYTWQLAVRVERDGMEADSLVKETIKVPADGQQYRDAAWRTRLPADAIAGREARLELYVTSENTVDLGSQVFTVPAGEGRIGRFTITTSTLYNKASGSCTFMVR